MFMEFITENESFIRLSAFLGFFFLLTIIEVFSPRRDLLKLRRFRWLNNFGLVVVSSFLVRFLFPTAAIGVAIAVDANQWGMLHYFDLPQWLMIVLGFIILDFFIYTQHVMFHSLPLLWRMHRVHHSDLDCDVTTGLRFHPFEIVVSMLIKFVTIIAVGPPVVAVILFEVVLNAASMFTHSNIKLPGAVDHILRFLIVTPDMHRVHHSMKENETNSNFGFFISGWDRIFGTYRKEPELGHEKMQIGLRQFSEAKWQNFRWLILLPFVGKITGYAINQRDYKEND